MKSRDGFTDKQGRVWLPDPTGRFTFRQIDGERWTALVRMTPSQIPGTDVEGEGLSNSAHPELAGPAGHVVASSSTEPKRALTWSYQVLHVTVDDDLQSWLNARGASGWELVSIAGANGGDWTTGGRIVAVMKRPLLG